MIPRVRATITYSDGSKLEVDKIFETIEMAQAEFDRLAALQSESVGGSVIGELCSHFEGEGPCELFAPTVTWGNDDEGNPE